MKDAEIALPGLLAKKRRILLAMHGFASLLPLVAIAAFLSEGKTGAALPIGTVWLVGIPMALLCLGNALVGFLNWDLRKAIALAKRDPTLLRLSAEGIHVPILLLTDPAFWRAAKASVSYIAIPWDDIESWSFHRASAAGRAAPQHLLTLRGESRNWATTATDIQPVGYILGIKCDAFTEEQTALVYDMACSYLGQRVIGRLPPAKGLW